MSSMNLLPWYFYVIGLNMWGFKLLFFLLMLDKVTIKYQK